MQKEINVIRYYVLCNRLKDVIRTGWMVWNVERDRVESVAEHIFGVQMLAIAMKSEYQYDVDILKVITMLAVHELEEILIGDLTMFDITKEDKEVIGHKAIEKVLSGLIDKKQIKNLILEFDARESMEAKFAYYCDKLECDLQCKLYDEMGCVDFNKQDGNDRINQTRVQELMKMGKSWSYMWMVFSQERYQYDDNFMAVSNYAIENNISKLDDIYEKD